MLLMRHGEAKRDGLGDLGLTEAGRHEVGELVRGLRDSGRAERLQAIVASPALRAQQTAAVIREHLDIPVVYDPDLCEMGEMERVERDEPFSAFVERVDGLLERLAQEYAGRDLIAVTHAGVIVGSMVSRFGIPRPGTGARLEPGYASVTEWHVQDSRWTLARYNVGPTAL